MESLDNGYIERIQQHEQRKNEGRPTKNGRSRRKIGRDERYCQTKRRQKTTEDVVEPHAESRGVSLVCRRI